jgi:hypothetical protein
LSPQYTESDYDADYFLNPIASIASTIKYLDEENAWDILNESDECLISDNSDDSDDSDNCEDDIAVANAAVDEEDSNVEDHSRGDADYFILFYFILEDMDNYHVQHELFSGHPAFLLFFSRDIVHQIVETNHYAEQFMKSRGILFIFRSLVRQWTPVTTTSTRHSVHFLVLNSVFLRFMPFFTKNWFLK